MEEYIAVKSKLKLGKAENSGDRLTTWQLAADRPASLGMCGSYAVSNIQLSSQSESRRTVTRGTTDSYALLATVTLLLAGDVQTNPGPDLRLPKTHLDGSVFDGALNVGDYSILRNDRNSRGAETPWHKVALNNDVEEALNCFMALFTDVANRHAPVRKTTIRASPAQWVDDDLRHLMDLRDQAKQDAQTSGSSEDYKQYKRMRNVVVRENRKKKRAFYKEQIEAHSKDNNTKQLWNVINNDWLGEVDKGNLVGAVLLDFSAAFDVVDHDILLAKLKCYGFEDPVVTWMESYLRSRKQAVFINGDFSSFKETKKNHSYYKWVPGELAATKKFKADQKAVQSIPTVAPVWVYNKTAAGLFR
ncbi:protein deubiquitination [Branchiostoma belcheri]|nr:protein deubiquitination [Branchiostoma belcheri]